MDKLKQTGHFAYPMMIGLPPLMNQDNDAWSFYGSVIDLEEAEIHHHRHLNNSFFTQALHHVLEK